MVEVIVLCEGHTERAFCEELVKPALAVRGVGVRGTLRGMGRKVGGIKDWAAFRSELVRLAKGRADRHVGLLVDFYALPDTWPGRTAAGQLPAERRGAAVEEAIESDLRDDLGGRFHPCMQVHEFETLLFVDPDRVAPAVAPAARTVSPDRIASQLHAVKAKFGAVERINDRHETRPSRRVAEIVPGFDKIAFGIAAVHATGLDALRAGCPWLDRWLTRLEALGGEQ